MKKTCDHCHLEFDENALFESKKLKGKFFCCKGCEGVYQLLCNEGLDDFYNKLGDSKLESLKGAKNSDLEAFDTEAFFKRYVKSKDGICEISFILEKIHCIACVWLIEKILLKTDGIIKAQINYTNNKATIFYNPQSIKISQIIKTIRDIGYDAQSYDPALQESRAKQQKSEYYTKMVVGIFCVMNIMWIAVAQYAGYFSGIDAQMKNILNVAGFALSTPVLFYSGAIFWRGAYSALKYKMPNMDLLVISGATLAYIYSIYASFFGGETYFESVAMIITFVLIGKFLEVRGKKSAIDSLDKIYAQMPLSVRILKDGDAKEVAIEAVSVGDVVQVFAGERIALDGELLSNEALCDESALNGESLPVEKSKGDCIYSGSLALEIPFNYKVSKVYQDSLMMQIAHLVEDSLNARAKIADMANHISRYFSLVMLSLAFITFLFWEYYLQAGFDRSLMVMVSVIIIACPCALALATPIASLVGLNEAFKNKILFKEARFLETIAKADTIVLDKTGTLTQGKLQVQSTNFSKNFLESKELRGILLQILAKNSHPISKAVFKFLKSESGENLEQIELDSINQISAKGIVANFKDSTYLGGNLELLKEHGVNIEGLKEQANSVFYFAKDKELLAEFSLQDSLKSDAKSSIEQLKKMGLKCILLSGDNKGACEKIATELGISEFYFNQSPIDKANFIKKLHNEKRIVVMAGDGINDSVALSASDISIAMGGGIDLAISVSDIVVLDDCMQGVADSFKIGRRTYSFILQNLGISLLYNALSIPLAMAGFVIPLVAALSMSLSSLIVVCNSLRIKRQN